MNVSSTRIFPSNSGSNINKIYYYDSNQSPFNTGSSYYVGFLKNGKRSHFGNFVSDTNLSFTNAGGTEINEIGWRIATASAISDPINDTMIGHLIDSYSDSSTYNGHIIPIGSNQIYISATGTIATTWTEQQYVESRNRWALQGNFDIQLDFSNFVRETGNTTAGWFGIEAVTRSGTGKAGLIRVYFQKYIDGLTYFNRDTYTTGTWGYQDNTAVVTTSGKLRLIKNNNTASFQYNVGAGWVDVGAGDLDITINRAAYEDCYIKLIIGGYDIHKTNLIISNFTINSGTVVTGSGWYLETGSAQHNALYKTMPDNCLVVGSDSGIDILDIDHSQFWTRFYTGSENAFHLEGSGDQRPQDFSWANNGTLYAAYGTPTADHGGLIQIPYRGNTIYCQVNTSSTRTQWDLGPDLNYSITNEKIPARNDRPSWSSGSSALYKPNVGIHHNSVLSVDSYIPGNYTSYNFYTPVFWAGANREGLRIFKRMAMILGSSHKAIDATGSTDASPLNTRYRYCKFDQNNGNIYYISDTTLYRAEYNTISSSFTSSQYTSLFSSDYNNTLQGSRTLNSQYRFCRDNNNYIYIPSHEGIYRLNHNLSSQVLYIANSGSLYNITSEFDLITSIKTTYCSESQKNYLLFGQSGTAGLIALGVVMLSNNSPSSSPRMIGLIDLTSYTGATAIQDIEVWKTEILNNDTDRITCFVAFSADVYKLIIDASLQKEGNSYSSNPIGSDFSLNYLQCLSVQHYDRFGNSLDTVPIFLNSPMAFLRDSNLPLSSSIQYQETKYITIPKRFETGSF